MSSPREEAKPLLKDGRIEKAMRLPEPIRRALGPTPLLRLPEPDRFKWLAVGISAGVPRPVC